MAQSHAERAAATIESARSTRVALVGALVTMPDTEAGAFDHAHDLPAMLGRDPTLCLELEAVLAALGWRPPAAVRHLEWAPVARARLEAALVGVPDALLDGRAAPGEWTVRQQLAHVELTDVRYGIATRYGAERSDDQPIAPPRSVYPPRDAGPSGTPSEPLSAIVARLRCVRAAALTPLLHIPEARLQRSVEWHTADHTVGLRLHRFAQHDLEMATDVRATLRALGFVPTRATRIAAALTASWGKVEAALLGVPAAVIAAPTPSGASLHRLLMDTRNADAATIAAMQAYYGERPPAHESLA